MAVATDAHLVETITAIGPPDGQAAATVQAALDTKTKPRGSLGRLEEMAGRVAAIRGTANLAPLRASIIVAAADHGVATERVSAYPREVTRQMLLNFAAGGAAINVLADRADADLAVVDAGVIEAVDDERINQLRVAPGTRNAADGPAMTREQALEAIDGGIGLARGLAEVGVGLVALGDMGIGNSTAASAICAALLPAAPDAVCGRGTGLDERGVARKVAVVGRMLAVNRPDAEDPVDVVAALGGLEIACLVGVALGAAAADLVVVLDGFITGAAALVAARLAPLSATRMIAAHRSPEPGHSLVLDELGLAPLLDLGLRLGEGSGAALALPLIQSALAIVADMATFADAGVTDAGR